MLAIVNVAFPIFGLIFVGFLAYRLGVLGDASSAELNRFVVYLGLPALLFESMAKAGTLQTLNLTYTLAFTAGMAVVFLVTLAIRMRSGVHFKDATINAVAASYPNAGFLGIPLCALTFGQPGIAPAVIATILSACILFAVAIILIEVSHQPDKRIAETVRLVGGRLLKNPILVAPVLGCLVAWSGHPLPQSLQRFFELLGAAAGPCALVSIGLFLASAKLRNLDVKGLGLLVAMKLVVQPGITTLLVFVVFPIPAVWAWSALLLSALPIGNGPFMLAALFDRDAKLMSHAILASTLLSLVTVSLILAWIPAT